MQQNNLIFNNSYETSQNQEMWEKQQSVIRRVYDEDTGRTR